MSYYLSSLLYPFTGEGKYRLFFVFPIMWLYVVMGWFPGGAIFQFLIISYMAMYLVKMLHDSADEDSNDEMCEFPGANSQEFFRPYLRFIGVLFFCFSPLIASDMWFKCDGMVELGLFILGWFYFPMALIRVMLAQDILELNPLGWWRSVRKILIPYVGLVVVSFAVVWSVCELMVLTEGSVWCDFVIPPLFFLILAICMNALGKFYRKHEEKIGW